MGNVCKSNKNHPSDYDDTGKNKPITAALKKDAKVDKQIKKLLFLGSGGSGKSTLFKQLRSIHGGGYDRNDYMTFIPHIHSQIIEQMQLAILCLLGDEDDYENEYKNGGDNKQEINPMKELSQDAQHAIKLIQSDHDHKLTFEIAGACKLLWNEPLIKTIYDQRAIMKIEDSSAYFWNKIDDIIKDNYCPDATDILMVRYRTTGVIEQKFTIQRNTFHIFDVGGQKSERKKWIHCFDDVTAVIFVASLSCYDEVMFEDETVNSMTDTLDLFSKICNEHYFVKTSMILFLNKKDLFLEKIQDSCKPITRCNNFEEYNGDLTSYDETTEYIKAKFEAKNKTPGKKTIYTHLTCATDQNNVNKVFNDVQHIIIEASLTSAGLMGDMDDDFVGGNQIVETEEEKLLNKKDGGGNTNNIVESKEEINDTNNIGDKNSNNSGGIINTTKNMEQNETDALLQN